ncbi:MAG: RluA family pseudouridine synthase [Candidatus Eisenbacteria bacterium]
MPAGSSPPDVEVLREDNHLLALNKPPGLLTQPSGTARDSLEARAKAYVRGSKGKTGNVFLHAVHRLDRVASGIVLFARTSKALARVSEEVRARRVRKVYLAIVERKPARREGTLRHFIRHRSHRAETARPGEEGARESALSYRVLGEIVGTGFLLEIELHTGRYHQIRAQLSEAGMPIVGDRRYGSRAPFPGGAIALHHAAMELRHPVTGETMRIEAPHPLGWPGG